MNIPDIEAAKTITEDLHLAGYKGSVKANLYNPSCPSITISLSWEE